MATDLQILCGLSKFTAELRGEFLKILNDPFRVGHPLENEKGRAIERAYREARHTAIAIRAKTPNLPELPKENADNLRICLEDLQEWCTNCKSKFKSQLAGTKQSVGGSKVGDILKLIEQGESHTLEFKETLEYDTNTNGKNEDVLFSSLKTIAGFLNAAGGTQLIGVDDSGKIKGIERDLSIIKHGNNDKFELKIRNCLKDRFEPQPIGKVDISFEKFTEGTICRIDVQKGGDIYHLDNEIYVRDGNMTQKLEGPPLTDWIQRKTNNNLSEKGTKDFQT